MAKNTICQSKVHNNFSVVVSSAEKLLSEWCASLLLLMWKPSESVSYLSTHYHRPVPAAGLQMSSKIFLPTVPSSISCMKDALLSVEMPYHNTLVIASSTSFTLHCPQRNKWFRSYKMASFILFIHYIRIKNILSSSQILKNGHCLESFLLSGC